MGTAESLSFLRREKEIAERESKDRREKELKNHVIIRPDVLAYKEEMYGLGIEIPDEVYSLIDLHIPPPLKVYDYKINRHGNRVNQEILRTLRLINCTGTEKYFEDMCNIYNELHDEGIDAMVEAARYPTKTADEICKGNIRNIKYWWPRREVGETLLKAVHVGLKSAGVDNYYYVVFRNVRDTLNVKILEVLLGIIETAGCGVMISDIKDFLPVVSENCVRTGLNAANDSTTEKEGSGNSIVDAINRITSVVNEAYEGTNDDYNHLVEEVERLLLFEELSDCLFFTKEWKDDEEHLEVLRKCAIGKRNDCISDSVFYTLATQICYFSNEALVKLQSKEIIEYKNGVVSVTYRDGLKRNNTEVFLLKEENKIVVVDTMWGKIYSYSGLQFEKTSTLVKLAKEYFKRNKYTCYN